MELTNRATRFGTLACVLAALGVAGYWSLRLAWADQLSRASDPAAVSHAVRLSPGNAGFRMKLARTLDKSGSDPTDALKAAATLNPADAGVWMRLGLRAEMRGDYVQAEHDLLEAAGVSNQFEPRWTLANYYVRRNDSGHLWPWLRQSLLVGSGDLDPVFSLCWNTSRDAGLILDQAIPDRRPVLNAYLRFLCAKSRLSAGIPVARRLAAIATGADRPALLAWNDRLLEANELPAALETWNALCSRSLLPYPPLNPDRGAAIANGSFDADSTGGGFDWRIPSVAGVSCGRNATPHYFWLSFSGTQPAHCEPLSQYLALAPGAKYRLRFQYRTSDMAAESGLRWQIVDTKRGAALASRSPWLSSPAWKDEEVLFTAPPTAPLARLMLTYQRVPGTPSIEGSVLLSSLRLDRLP